jgi:NADH-quinone oxidoreductase subunit M
MHLIGPWYRGSFRWMEGIVASGVDFASFTMNGLYRFVQPMLFLLTAAVLAVAWLVL